MVITCLSLFLFSLLLSNIQCYDQDQKVINLQQPGLSEPSNSIFKDLILGELNFLHTSDTHGWYAGHLNNQDSFTGDWGDFISFSTHFQKLTNSLGLDVLLIDSGDKHDGNGLSDITIPNGIISTRIFNTQSYDLITLGNHELYNEDYSIQEFELSVNHFKDNYISTNVEFKDQESWINFGQKFKLFETKFQKKKILTFSFLFNFQKFNSRTRVIPIKEILKQDWFNELLLKHSNPKNDSDKLDLILIFGHIPITNHNHDDEDELLALHLHLRKFFPNLLIQYFGAHSHIRDFNQFDSKSSALQSGRYCETLGFLSINFTNYNSDKDSIFNRRYIDFNRESFKHHLNKISSFHDLDFNQLEFDTEKGLSISSYITHARSQLNLTFIYGNIPKNYMMYEYPLDHEQNLYNLLRSEVLPLLSYTNDQVANRIILINSGSIRYDLFRGNFTKDTEFIVSPFKNKWEFIKLPLNLALQIEPYLNRGDFILLNELQSQNYLKRNSQLQEFKSLGGKTCPIVNNPSLKKGYVTFDYLGCDGDDVNHNSIPFYPSPNVIQSLEINDEESQQIDFIVYDFVKPHIIAALNSLDPIGNYSNKDFKYYGNETTGDLLIKYVVENWS
ncbi:hypothetical protein WICMUC_000741 [Wickerhamomyces mucosus]|uniref:Putative 5'-nucleotidase C-terminal domain-containing protein n=1 Tax=Wickerhamomyces mucosus TaxID=1378264 RepID=A0A9P8TIE2_9ASCO|nr:hypothetical protein WICMUC_000741 [Wickerhamomyces mucosus]